MQVIPLKRELQEVKTNKYYLESMLNKDDNMPPVFSNMEVVRYGNPEAAHIITIIVNVLCEPCARSHTELKSFLRTHDNFQCFYVFYSNHLNGHNITCKILTSKDGHRRLDEWFLSLNNSMAPKWVNGGISDDLSASIIHNQWVELAGIEATPTYYLNGRKLSKSFHIKDFQLLASHIKDRD